MILQSVNITREEQGEEGWSGVAIMHIALAQPSLGDDRFKINDV